MYGLAIAKLVIGAKYIDDCSYEPLVPVFLVVSGTYPWFYIGLAWRIIGNWRCLKKKSVGEESNISKAGTVIAAVALVFHIIWMICGCIWVYPTRGKVKDGGCDSVLINFASASLTADLSMIGGMTSMIVPLFLRRNRACVNASEAEKKDPADI